MHTVLTRANALAAYTMSVLAFLTFVCFASTFFLDYSAPAKMNTVKVVVKHVPDYSASREKNDLGFLTFDLQADLTPLFNWNVKQLFLYLTAEYETNNNVVNQVVLWDKIIQRGDNAVLDYRSMNTKYYFWDDGNGLKYVNFNNIFKYLWLNLFFCFFRGHKNVTLTLSWNVVPNAGNLPRISSTGSHSFAFPVDYTATRVM